MISNVTGGVLALVGAAAMAVGMSKRHSRDGWWTAGAIVSALGVVFAVVL